MPDQSRNQGLLTFVLVLLLVTAAAVPGQAAESSLRLEDFELTLLPEYDTASPTALIMYAGTLRNTSNSPYAGPIVFAVPGQNASVNSTCELDTAGTHDPQPNSVSPSSDGTSQVSWTPSVPIAPGEAYSFHIEYYADVVQGGPEKKVDFAYIPDYSPSALTLLVVQPQRSSDYAAELAADASGLSGEFQVHQYDFAGLEPGQPLQFSFTYTKADDDPSFTPEAGQAQSASGAGGNEAGPAVWGLLGGFVVALGILLFLVGTGRLGSSSGKRSSTRTGRRGQGVTPLSSSDERRRARRLLLEGRISEETYRLILAELREERRKAK